MGRHYYSRGVCRDTGRTILGVPILTADWMPDNTVALLNHNRRHPMPKTETLEAWVELWEVEPKLVPPGWARQEPPPGQNALGDWERSFVGPYTGNRTVYADPENPEPIDLAAQIGVAVEWLFTRMHGVARHGAMLNSRSMLIGVNGLWCHPEDGDTLPSLLSHCRQVLLAQGKLKEKP